MKSKCLLNNDSFGLKKILLSPLTTFIACFVFMLLVFDQIPVFIGDDELFAGMSLKLTLPWFLADRSIGWPIIGNSVSPYCPLPL
jgi:hypothetical protein